MSTQTNQPAVNIRPAVPGDAQLIADLIYGLALYEKAPEECKATADTVRAQIFGPRPAAEVIIAELDGRPVGFALYFQSFSTWLCKPGMYLEDLFVQPEHRCHGVGGALLRKLASICIERDYGRMEWACLEWNELAKVQYRKIGGVPMEDWRTWRMTSEAIAKLAHG